MFKPVPKDIRDQEKSEESDEEVYKLYSLTPACPELCRREEITIVEENSKN